MIFRVSLVLLFAVMTLNLEIAANIAKANPIEKGILVLCAVSFLATRRIYVVNLFLLGVIVLVTAFCASQTEFRGFSFDRYGRGLVSLVAPWLLLCAEPTERDRDTLIRVLAWSPIAAVVVGVFYDVLGKHPLWYVDFLGATRLQGSLIPAFLGGTCYAAVFACMLGAALLDRRLYLTLAAANFVILVLSAARMPMVLSVLLAGVVFLTMMRKSAGIWMAALTAGPMVAIAGFVLFGAAIVKRFSSQSLSGREMIWQALDVTLHRYPKFGIGIGHQMLVIPADVEMLSSTVAAHNEYLRLAVETGYVGAGVIFVCIALMCVNVMVKSRVRNKLVFFCAILGFFIYAKTDNTLSYAPITFGVIVASFAFARRDPRTGDLGRVTASRSEPQLATDAGFALPGTVAQGRIGRLAT